MASTSKKRHEEWGTSMAGSTINQKSALSAAYAELGKELTSGKLKSVGSYTLGKVIGEGTYGKVRLGTHRLTGTRVAIKQVPKAHSATLTREIHHHRRLHHPNVMQLYEVMATESYIWMVAELCAGGELYDYLVERSTMPEPEARRIFGQLCLAVAYVHDRGIVHRDLKLENVLLDERCNVKVGDFGFTREYEAKKLMETFCGTTGYAAPEMLAGRKYTGQEVDIWSLGVILYALLCGALPFDDDDDHVMKGKILKGEYELPEELSDESRNLITSILQQDPSHRPTIKGILNHPWFHKTMVTTPMSTVEEDEDEVSQHGGFFADTDEKAKGHKNDQSAEQKATVSTASIEPASISDQQTHQGSMSRFSEASFFSAMSKSDSESSDRQSNQTETTEPTTEEEGEEEMHDIVSSDTLLNLTATERGALALHRNESQSTIRRQGSSGSDASKANPSLKTTASLLTTHHEAPSSPEESRQEDAGTLAPQSFPLEKRGSQNSSRGGHHRTPSRSKRVSSGSLSEPIPPVLDYRPTDFLSLLEQSSPAMFSTIVEQNILHQLSSLGMDVGQIVHSVINEACDASGAMWWILKKKSEERQDSHSMYSPMSGTIPLTPLPPRPPPKEITISRRSSRSASPSSYPSSLPLSKNIIKPSPVYASKGYRATNGSRYTSSDSTHKEAANERSTSPPQHPPIESPLEAPKLETRPVERHRTSSLSIRIANAFSGKDKESRRDTLDPVPVGSDRSKSPVGAISTKMKGDSPSSLSRSEKERERDKTKEKKKQSKSTPVDEKSNGRISSSSRSSPMRSGEDVNARMTMSTSIDTFTTMSSNNSVHDGSPVKGKSKPSFLSTFRTWFEDKDKTLSGKKKKQQQRNLKTPTTAHAAAALHVAHGPASHTASRSNSVRRISAAGPYPPSTRSPRHTLNHRGSLSRRSSSGSNHHLPMVVATSRPKASRRPSAGSITPTATMNSDELAYALQHHRGSRPSSAQSARRPLVSAGGLHGKSGSASSSNSVLKHQQQLSRSGGSLKGVHGRRSSLEGGTTVRRHRQIPSPSVHHHQMARSDSSHSRPTTPSRLRITDDGMDGLGLALHSPRRSLDLDSNHGRASPSSLTPRASQSVFVAHRSRTSYKPLSASAPLHRQDRDQIEPAERKDPPLRAWRRSWGKPPPCWLGPVDAEPPAIEDSKDKPKLRNVFANKESDDDWEDEEDDPVYAGGLGQLDSSAWTNAKSTTGRGGKDSPARHDGMPGQFSRYAGVRSIFQPPSLGRETTPRAWTPSDENNISEEQKENNTGEASITAATNTSRVRAAAPAFKGADILEEDEEEDE